MKICVPADEQNAAVIPLQCADVRYDVSKWEAGAGSRLAVTFEEIYTRFRRPVWSLARRLTQSDDEALDACQEIFLRIWRGLDGFRNEAKLSTWVFQIAWNFLRSYRRARGRQPIAVESLNDDKAVSIGALNDRAPDAERRAVPLTGLSRIRRLVKSVGSRSQLTESDCLTANMKRWLSGGTKKATRDQDKKAIEPRRRKDRKGNAKKILRKRPLAYPPGQVGDALQHCGAAGF